MLIISIRNNIAVQVKMNYIAYCVCVHRSTLWYIPRDIRNYNEIHCNYEALRLMDSLKINVNVPKLLTLFNYRVNEIIIDVIQN